MLRVEDAAKKENQALDRLAVAPLTASASAAKMQRGLHLDSEIDLTGAAEMLISGGSRNPILHLRCNLDH